MYFDRISRRCRSPITTRWSRHSRRAEFLTKTGKDKDSDFYYVAIQYTF
jgi:hypothetical protein